MATVRQKIAVKKLAEILRSSKKQKNITIGKILKEAGYSESQARASTQVTQSKGFQSLLDKYLPEDKVYQTHSDLMEQASLSHYKMDAKLKDNEIEKIVESVRGCKVIRIARFKGEAFVTVYFWVPDGSTRKAAADMAYKLRGNYAPEKKEHTIAAIEIVKYGDKN